MAKKNKTIRSSRQKAKKPVDPTASPFKKELKDNRNRKAIVIGVVIIVIVMIGGMIVPYLGGQTKSFSLPDTALKGDETIQESEGINAQSISLGQTFEMKDKEYIVLFGDVSSTSELASKITRDTLYVVDKDKFVNNNLTKDVNALDEYEFPKSAKDIKIKKDVALIKIKDKKVVEFFATKDDVEEYIKQLK